MLANGYANFISKQNQTGSDFQNFCSAHVRIKFLAPNLENFFLPWLELGLKISAQCMALAYLCHIRDQ